ncbi:M48 family metalloprotease [Microcoleus sp. herbarium12]|uniref:M48 family metalloprotease n=1 Tax=Microcoleus sp. herbarium12 TaxID=3055437 RepID=UPI002FD1BC44
MAINQKEFDKLVKNLEEYSQRHPGSYRLRVALFAVLGYAYIFLILAGLFALIGLLVFVMMFSHHINGYIIKFGILLLIPAWAIVRSLWVTFPHPQGLKLSRDRVPHLFAMVDELTAKLEAPRFHNILLNREFNAAVVQVPRLGIFGWQKNYLLLGLPLMQSLSLEQFKAVLAHELGHLSGNHSRFAGWIYRIRKTWLQIYERLYQSEQHGASMLFNSFLEWYWPSFNAYSFTLARMDEYEADRCAAQLAGVRHAAEALINVKIKARFLESSFWSDIQKQVAEQVDPPDNAYSSMLTFLHGAIAEAQTNLWLEQALAEKTDNADTHPCLSDRLKSLGYLRTRSPKLLQSVTIQTSAAEHLLGNSLQQFATQFDRDWKEAASTPWRQQYAYLQEIQSKLQALEQKAQVQTLDEREAWERAHYTLEVRGGEAAVPLLQDVLQTHPDCAEANYSLGQILLQKDDAAGIACIEKAMTQRIDWVRDGCELIYCFFWQRGQTDKADKYRDRAEQHSQLLLKAQQERASASDRDKLKPHTLKPSEVDELKQQLAPYSQVEAAYLVEKVVTYFPEKPFCILGIVRKRGLMEGGDAAQNVADLLAKSLQFTTQAYVIILNHSSSGNLQKKMSQVEGSLILKR